MSNLPPNASVATALEGGKLCNASAGRNVDAIVEMMRTVAPPQGRALEIASGTGQHVQAFATALPAITWHPSDIAPDRLTSIDAYCAGLSNVRPARMLDVTAPDWAARQEPFDLIYLGNLLHLIPHACAQMVLIQATRALCPSGIFIVYGPFMRSGSLTSDGDARFHADLRHVDPEIGYKDDDWVQDVLKSDGLAMVSQRDMPANNLCFIARKGPA